jgi:uncharacterized protein (TIGR02680 family)
MTDRWVLNRAGIVNVYQYGQETLDFGGGRLLLRGVNGSGKSTAMNLLLPFLLDGDTRRIDAAGEQAGVLKAWMLSDRNDAQPIGYLWLELARGEDHVTIGCGIKANRASDNVTTWWWVTSRRPGIDLSLVEDRHPLSAEALRAVLAPDPVFRHEQRSLYRAEVRGRLYGGAEIDQHIRLLHIVRNPRVGDRIDLDLPGHLHDALPQLSEAALLDAAQPLDDLEEHRRNVGELTRTSATLEALGQVYTSYARAELRRRAAQARELAAVAERAGREAMQAAARTAEADRALIEAGADEGRLEGDQERLRTELKSLEDSPAYALGRDLEDLRNHVAMAADAVRRAERLLAERTQARAAARQSVVAGTRNAGRDRDTLAGHLRDLADHAVAAGLPLGAPDLPPLPTVTLEPDLLAPAEVPADGGVRRRLEEVRAAVVHRRGDVEGLNVELAAVDAAERRLRHAEDALATAEVDAEAKRETFTVLRQELDRVTSAWRVDLEAWTGRMDEHRAAAGLPPLTAPDLGADLAGRRDDVVTALNDAADDVVAHHLSVVATLDARRRIEQSQVDERAAAVAALDATVLPAPPAFEWQRPERTAVLAELIDFRPDVDPVARAGLEAAMEAAGLLSAELTTEGALALPEGGLVVRAGPAAPQPLSRLLAVTDALDASADPSTIVALLDTISVAEDDLDGETERTVVTVDGRFRIGLLRGHHAKPEAEHIGLTARRASLERRRIEARRRHDEALALLAETQDELALARQRGDAARTLRAAVPATRSLTRAIVAAQVAEDDLERVRLLVTTRRREHQRADEEHGEAVEKSRRLAANLGLPTDPAGLRRIEAALGAVQQLTYRAGDALTALVRAAEGWRQAAERWQDAVGDEAGAEGAVASARADHAPVAARLATIEDSIGAAYAEIVADIDTCGRDLKRVTVELGVARRAHLEAGTQLATARARGEELHRVAEGEARRCVAVLPDLRRVFDVPGLLAAATDAVGALRQPVDESPAGVRALAAAIDTHVPPPARADITAEGVRQSLRQRRDTLGAGWDAADRQADEALPLVIEINGPQGRFPLAEAIAVVGTRLRELTALLSSEQDGALRNLLQGLVAREVAEKLHAAGDLIARMNRRLDEVKTTHGIGVSLRWRRRDSLDPELTTMVDLLSRPPDLRTTQQDHELRLALSHRLDGARRDDPEAPYRDLIGRVLDYRSWHDITVLVRRAGRTDERLTRRTALSEGEKKIVSYLPLFAAVAASCDSLAETAPAAPRFLLLDDAFAKVSEDNHAMLFGLLVELDLDFIATSERLWGTHATVPELAITEVIRDAGLGVIVLEHSYWDGATRTESV